MLRCPFHDDDRASLSINLETGLWMCFGCSKRGTIFRLAEYLDQELDGEDVLFRSLKADLDPVEPADFRDLAAQLQTNGWMYPLPIIEYFFSRGIRNGNVIQKFRLGYDPDKKRIAMPYYDGDKVVAIKYRYPDGFKSYEPGSRHYIYNVNEVRVPGIETIIVCEGESDTHAVWSAVDRIATKPHTIAVVGVPGVGSGLPSRKMWELYALEFMWANAVYIAFDADDAGDAGAELAMSVIGGKARRMRPVSGKDMAEHLKEGGSLVDAGMDRADL